MTTKQNRRPEKAIIFVCFTPYHLFNAAYYGRFLSGMANRLLIWNNASNYDVAVNRFKDAFDEIESINISSNSLLKRQILKTIYGGRLFFLSSTNKVIQRYCSDCMVLMLFNDQHIISKRILNRYANYFKDIVLVEEGMASYLIRERKVKRSVSYIVNRCLGIQYEPYIGASKEIKTWFVKHPELLPIEKKEGKSVIEQTNVFLDGMWEEVFDDILGKICFDKNDSKKCLLWLGQPLEYDGISTNDQLQWLHRVRRIIKDNFYLIIKPHPREEKEKYESLRNVSYVEIVDLGEYNWMPIELFANKIKPDIVLTVYSTAARNIQEMGLDCKVVFCYEQFSLRIDEKKEIGVTKGSNVYTVDSLKGLEEIIYYPHHSITRCNRNTVSADINYLESVFE